MRPGPSRRPCLREDVLQSKPLADRWRESPLSVWTMAGGRLDGSCAGSGQTVGLQGCAGSGQHLSSWNTQFQKFVVRPDPFSRFFASDLIRLGRISKISSKVLDLHSRTTACLGEGRFPHTPEGRKIQRIILPLPFIIFPGISQFAKSPCCETCNAPSMVMSIFPPLIIAKLSLESKADAPFTTVMVSLPALIRSASTSSAVG